MKVSTLRPLEQVSRTLVLFSMQVTLIAMWLLAAWPKLTDPQYALRFGERFQGTWLAGLPGGVGLQMTGIGILEVVAALVAVASLVRLEALRGSLVFFRLSLGVAALTFCALSFGLRVIGDHQGAASLFFYLGATMIAYVLSFRLEEKK